MPEGLNAFEKLIFNSANPPSIKDSIGVWRNGKKWFRNGYDLVDYHNHIGT